MFRGRRKLNHKIFSNPGIGAGIIWYLYFFLPKTELEELFLLDPKSINLKGPSPCLEHAFFYK